VTRGNRARESSLPRRSFLVAAGLIATGVALETYGPDQLRVFGSSVQAGRDAGLLAPAATPDGSVRLAAAPDVVDLGGRSAKTWTFNGTLPGPELRARAGQVLRVDFENRLPAATSIHWHGVAIRNDMDGVPKFTQSAIAPGGRFLYEFAVPDPGTYFFHPHVGLQLDRGLYGVLIVEDPAETGRYDREAVIVLDDWTDGVGETPDQILKRLQAGEMDHTDLAGMDGNMAGMDHSMAGMDHGGTGAPAKANPSAPLGDDTGDIRYPLYLINGRQARSPATLSARPGERVRLRIVNAAADTAFRLALGGHRLTVTHTDGYPVLPVTADALLLGMGERYDAIVQLEDGVFPLVAAAEGKSAQARAVVRTNRGAAPRASVRPPELRRRLLTVDDLRAAAGVDLGLVTPQRTHRLVLDGNMATYRWTINGHTMHGGAPLEVRKGERVRLVFDNRSTMFHPMHLHGHTFQVRRSGARDPGPRKDTVIVRPAERVIVDFDAANPGRWMLHCHNAYHQAGGMMTELTYAP
jgi:FtsP/CotA-like multicopper oxidase with cupredoxin domain